MLTAGDAFAGPFCFRGRRAAPAAPVATARADGYRVYSYEPGIAPALNTGVRTQTAKPPYLDARSKALGRY